MIKGLATYLSTVPSVFIDGLTYVAIAFFGAWGVAFSSDEAAKFLDAFLLFWLKAACASLSGSLLALKMYRSTQFADHQQAKKGDTYPPFKPGPQP